MLPPPASNAALNALRAENEALHAQLQAERTAAASQQQEAADQVRFHTVFQNSPLAHKIIMPDLSICQANASLAAMLGYAHPEQVVGRRILDFVHPQYHANWHHLQEQLWAHKLPYFTLETCLSRTDGSFLWCQVHSILFLDKGQELGYTTLIDTTEHTQLQKSMQRLYDSQETVLHLVAHDIRNPLAHIKLATDLLRRDQDNKKLTYLTIIEQAVHQAEAILKDVLYIGQLNAVEMPKQPINFSAYLDAQLASHRLAAQVKGITLELGLPSQAMQANLNPNKFGRVVSNLLNNALKFTPAGGYVRVRLTEHAGRPRLTIQDTGVGIPLEYQAHLFDKFSKAAREGLVGESTTGLGLFITQQIVRLHGGNIWVESRENEGTTFFIDL
jgi:two-component system sensor histidine kinase VicK